MPFVPLVAGDEIAAAFTALAGRLSTGQPFEKFIGWPGGVGATQRTIYWHPREQLWALADSWNQGYWFGFGRENPGEVHHFAPTFQIGLPLEGVNRRRAGCFLRAEGQNQIFVAHSGNVGGSKPGVGKTAFLAFYGSENRARVHWPDRKQTEHIPIGALNDEDLLAKLAAFAKRVHAFKLDV